MVNSRVNVRQDVEQLRGRVVAVTVGTVRLQLDARLHHYIEDTCSAGITNLTYQIAHPVDRDRLKDVPHDVDAPDRGRDGGVRLAQNELARLLEEEPTDRALAAFAPDEHVEHRALLARRPRRVGRRDEEPVPRLSARVLPTATAHKYTHPFARTSRAARSAKPVAKLFSSFSTCRASAYVPSTCTGCGPPGRALEYRLVSPSFVRTACIAGGVISGNQVYVLSLV